MSRFGFLAFCFTLEPLILAKSRTYHTVAWASLYQKYAVRDKNMFRPRCRRHRRNPWHTKVHILYIEINVFRDFQYPCTPQTVQASLAVMLADPTRMPF